MRHMSRVPVVSSLGCRGLPCIIDELPRRQMIKLVSAANSAEKSVLSVLGVILLNFRLTLLDLFLLYLSMYL